LERGCCGFFFEDIPAFLLSDFFGGLMEGFRDSSRGKNDAIGIFEELPKRPSV
jgi:hypothetical protein